MTPVITLLLFGAPIGIQAGIRLILLLNKISIGRALLHMRIDETGIDLAVHMPAVQGIGPLYIPQQLGFIDNP